MQILKVRYFVDKFGVPFITAVKGTVFVSKWYYRTIDSESGYGEICQT